MYLVYQINTKKEKKMPRKKYLIFLDPEGIRAHNLHVIGSVGQNIPKSLQFFTTIKYAEWAIAIKMVHWHDHIKSHTLYLQKIVRTNVYFHN